ncbi:hypothetical protein HYDPIDRAFT_41016 [Hydnomerulius pinastri MD-312]|uniref:Large ribosomal subunit protein bL28c n=1 Tax=Hydnomerulius pinastri MD-312 TaxID=994086 RepID=A0A0C9VZ00_9AGAM|nr:hypothetical protein HYDPIDRAFT_41016 [Hydnomerulius pinastri MD-312]
MIPTLPALSTLPPITSQPFKRATLGLFHGKLIQYGNNVPHSKKKTRRTWLPNIQTKTYNSEVLESYVKVKLTTKALKTINKHGSIDKYLLSTPASLLGDEGMRLRILVREKLDARNAQKVLDAQDALRAKAAAEKEAKNVEENALRLEEEEAVTEEPQRTGRVGEQSVKKGKAVRVDKQSVAKLEKGQTVKVDKQLQGKKASESRIAEGIFGSA